MELTPQHAGSEWEKGRFRPAYLLYGEDDAGKLAALEELKARLKPDPFNVSEFPGGDDASAPELVAACNTPPMFSDRRLVVVRDLKFGAQARRQLAEYLRAPLESTTLVLFSPERKLEAKDPLAAAVSALGGVVAFKALREGEAASRLRAQARAGGVELSQEAADRMVEEAGTEWGILRAEIEKLLLYAKGRASAGLEDAQACLGYRRELKPWDFTQALERRDLARAMRLLGRLLEDMESFSVLAQIKGTLNGQLKAKRMLKAGLPQPQLQRELRLPEFRLADYLREAAKLNETRLLRELRACLETEVSLKSKSWLEPAVELERLVAAVCGGKN